MGKIFEVMDGLMVAEQFTDSCPSDMSMFLKKRKPGKLEELAQMTELYVDAQSKKLSTKKTVVRQDVKDNKFAGCGGLKNVIGVLHAVAEATELYIVQAEHRRLGMSLMVAFAGATATNVDRRDTTLRIAGIRCRSPSSINNDEKDKVLVAL